MSGKGALSGLKSYLGTLVATILFPLLWLKALRLARRHADVDARGRLKVVAAIAIGLGIAVVGAGVLLNFFAAAEEGMYEKVDGRLAKAVGESEYQDQGAIITASESALPTVAVNLAKAQSDVANRTAINATQPSKENTASLAKARENVTKLQATQETMTKDLAKATARKAELEPNHARYLEVSAAVEDQDDARALQLVSSGPAYKDRDANAAAAFAIKDRSIDDMQRFALLFLWPSLLGAFFAPLAFALGSILRKAFEESDTVGFKPYPGAAAGLFLLFGAFGLPSLLFAAWTFNDAFKRSEDGQIAL